MGRLLDPADTDFFVFTLPPDGPTRLQVEVRWHTVAERAQLELLTAYGRKVDGSYPSQRSHHVRQIFFLEPDNAYYLTLRAGGAEFPFVYELAVDRLE